MKMQNFRVKYQIGQTRYKVDFSMSGSITEETKNISAWNKIKEAHPSATHNDVLNISIEELNVW